MKEVKWVVIIFLLLFPCLSYASDPTGLFIILIGIPFIAVASLFFLISCFAPRVGKWMMITLLIAHMPVFVWAGKVGYMESAGGWLFSSFLISVFGLIIAIKKMKDSLSDKTPSKSKSRNTLESGDYIDLSEFSKLKEISETKVIQMIKDGFYMGRLFDGEWRVHPSELDNDNFPKT